MIQLEEWPYSKVDKVNLYVVSLSYLSFSILISVCKMENHINVGGNIILDI